VYTPNEIHRITGCLYLSTRSSDVQVTLGERVLDTATGTARDVDILIARSGSTGLIGAEVKAERRPLDTPIVEGLCAKLNDMPSLTTKQIVSSAGFTAPAIRKAEKHGVQCLKLVQGQLPPFQTIDMSQLKTMGYIRRGWARHDSRIIVPPSWVKEVQGALQADLTHSSLRVSWGSNDLDLAGFRNAALTDLLNKLDLPPVAAQHAVQETTLVFDPQPVLHAPNGDVPIEALRVSGLVKVEQTTIPLDKTSVYLETPSGKPLSGAAIMEIPEGLIGIVVGDGGPGIQVVMIPEALRNVRPNREVIEVRIPPEHISE